MYIVWTIMHVIKEKYSTSYLITNVKLMQRCDYFVYNCNSIILTAVHIVCFIHNALNHSNKVCRLLLLAKLHSISSTFATNYRHLCYKYELVQTDWHSGLAHLLGENVISK